ncbi:MAG: hypothetical protein CM15mP3_09450 [Candidatus Poseidoniales archaeon]|nr:MAG: hypothetical protein CM15mP3_09450 [Candidatus Poseidoniales archaeon]
MASRESLETWDYPVAQLFQVLKAVHSKVVWKSFCSKDIAFYTSKGGSIMRGYTHHEPWEFCSAEVVLTDNSLTESFDFGIADHSTPDLTHYSDGVM